MVNDFASRQVMDRYSPFLSLWILAVAENCRNYQLQVSANEFCQSNNPTFANTITTGTNRRPNTINLLFSHTMTMFAYQIYYCPVQLKHDPRAVHHSRAFIKATVSGIIASIVPAECLTKTKLTVEMFHYHFVLTVGIDNAAREKKYVGGTVAIQHRPISCDYIQS
jgi:hypothetical protein